MTTPATPKTHAELFQAVRELAGPRAYVAVSSEITYLPNVVSGKPAMRTDWRVYISPCGGKACCSTDFVPSLAAAWDMVLAHYQQTPVDLAQFDAADAEKASVAA